MAACLRPSDLATALKALSARPLTILAGATDVIPAHLGRPLDHDILDITALDALRGITDAGDHHRIGALTTWRALADAALPPGLDGLRRAARAVGGPQIQTIGTLGGNLCNASPAADGVPNLLALDAEVELASTTGNRHCAVADFILGNHRTARRPDELLTAVRVPKAGPGTRATFLKLGARRSLVIAVASVAVVVEATPDGTIGRLRIAVGACSPVPVRLPALERALVGAPLDDGLPHRVTADHLAPLSPVDDIRASADYRRHAALILVRRALAQCARGDAVSSPRSSPWRKEREGAGEQGTAEAVTFRLNGHPVTVPTAPMRPLAEVLREWLGQRGTKIGCGVGDCGACTVLVDGHPVCACLMPVGPIAGRSVETVEGLASQGQLNRLQAAFHRLGAAQCGFCTPGMLMAATALLRHTPRPTRRQVEDAIGGVLCRCTGYLKIVDAVLEAADGADTPPVPLAPGAAVGARSPKTDGVAKLTGTERYGADGAPPDTLWLRVVRSPHAHARFTVGDLDAVRRRWPGLALVLSAADIPVNRFGVHPVIKDQPVLAEGLVRHPGEAVLALVGDAATLEALTDTHLPIAWHPLPPALTIDAALATGAPVLHADRPDNVLIRGRVVRGDVDAGFAQAAVVASIAIETAFVEHAYIEPEAGFARRIGDRLEIAACTQSPYLDRDEVARILGLAPAQVRILPTAVGGGFGGKLDLSVQPLLAVAAWRLGRPVRCTYSRPESMAATTKRHPARIKARAAADRDGRLLAVAVDGDFNTGAYASWGPTVANRVPVHAAGPYAVPAVRALTRAVHTHNPPAGAFRGFGVPQAAIAHEALMDDLALRLGLDPLDFRRRNALRAGQTTATGQILRASCGLPACLEALRPRWREWRDAAETFNRSAARPRRRGVGLACMWYGIGNTSLSNPSTIRLGLRPDGRVTLYSGAIDIGQGSNTVLVQIAADALGVSMDRFDVVCGDTDRTEDAGKTSASRQTFISGAATLHAAQDLRARLRDLDLNLDLNLDLDLTTLPVDADGNVATGVGRFDPPTTPLDADGQGEPYATYAFAAQMAEVEVDLDLGTVRVRRMVAAHDVGRAINPQLVEGQIHGGIAQGLGLALMEEYIPGRSDNLHDYLIPTAGDMPAIDIVLIEDGEPLGPHGAKGIGEPALIPTAPAILNAIHHATGARVTRIPATPERVLAALRYCLAPVGRTR